MPYLVTDVVESGAALRNFSKQIALAQRLFRLLVLHTLLCGIISVGLQLHDYRTLYGLLLQDMNERLAVRHSVRSYHRAVSCLMTADRKE